MSRFLVAFLFLLLHTSLSPTSIESSWLWGWVWGAESSVSVVDRSPPLTFRSRPAAFGPEFGDPLLGYVIPLSAFTTPCSFIREAQRLGAKAVVVGGEDPGLTDLPDTLVNMYSKDDASDIFTPSTYITFADYNDLTLLISSSTTRHAGLQTLSLLITTQYSAWEWYSPILTFIVILILPSCLTFVTLLIHRIRLARAARRDRAPEHLVKSLPWRVWNGTSWEKHPGSIPHRDDPSLPVDVEAGEPSGSHPHDSIPWCETQLECAICLSEFAKGDRVRELPCHHIFHLDEVDAWLINRKKVCPVCKADVTQPWQLSLVQKSSNSASSANTDPPPSHVTPSPTERTPLLHDQRGDAPFPND
ncbi:hypothetical protein JVU11DRAFT_3506 [Chiua virens]|nr:hypothetical protein JVU11DRAFT_3506 [Chiua virens]